MRRQLALLAAATTSLVMVAFVVPLGLLVRDVAADSAINAATSQAQSIVPVVATSDRGTIALVLDQANAGSDYPVTVFFSDGSSLGASTRRTPAVELASRGRSLSVSVPAGRQILLAVQGRPDGPAVIAATVPDTAMHRGVTRAWLVLAALGLVLIGIGILVADQLARRLVRPIRHLAAVSDRLARGDLEARATADGPVEIRGVAVALDNLADRIQDLLREERETVADLSHRLRTPLMALRLDVEALSGNAAARLGSDLDAVERAVNQAILDARRPDHRGTATPGRCDATEVVTDRVGFWAALAEDTGRPLELDVADRPLFVTAPREQLEAAVDALLGNVFAHTPDGTAFSVSLTGREDGVVRLIIRDQGPGIPSGIRPMQRGTSAAGSTGLGLDIARRVATTYGGRLTISQPPGGGAEIVLDLAFADALADS